MSPSEANLVSSARARLVVVANRLPVDQIINPDGSTQWERSPGGLVSALAPVMTENDGAWVGWPGTTDGKEIAPFMHDEIQLHPISMTQSEYAEFYEGFSNSTLWPLYHDLVAKPVFQREWWMTYQEINHRFAQATATVAAEGATVWVHDYQLQLVPAILRSLRPDLKIGFFLHIPFPPTELFTQLPWRDDILRGMLGADLVGFQVAGGAQNFIRLVARRLGLSTTAATVRTPDDRLVRARAFPISIDTKYYQQLASTQAVKARTAQIQADIGKERRIFLGIDRLDYTKGINARLQAFGELLADGHFSVREATFIQVASPSRERVEEYRRLRSEIDELVGHINGEHSEIGFPAISYLTDSFPAEEMAALYAAADVMVVTPLRDGMNLVAKEFVACRSHNRGSLILSEFAGAALELKSAYLVNPFDIDGMKAQMLAAFQADREEQRRRMTPMRRRLRRYDVARWANQFLSSLQD